MQRPGRPGRRRLGLREDVLRDPVADEEAWRVGADLGERIGDPARLGDERDRQGVRDGGEDALRRRVGLEEAVLHALHEIGVPLRGDVEQAVARAPQRRDGDVVPLALRLLQGHARDVGKPPVGPGREVGVRRGEGHVEPLALRELMGVLHDDADPARERDVVQDEADLHVPEPVALVALERFRGEEGEIGLALLLPPAPGGQVADRGAGGGLQTLAAWSERGEEVTRDACGGDVRTHVDRVGAAAGDRDARAVDGKLRRGDVIVGQQSPQLLEGALAPRREVERVVHRPERVVRHAEHDVGVAACGLIAEPADEPHRVREVLDGLHRRDRDAAAVVGPDGGLECRQAVVRAEVGDERARLELAQRPCGGGDRGLVGVREQHRPRRLRELREDQARRVAGAAGRVDPQVGAGQQRPGEAVADDVLDDDQGIAAAVDALFPVGHDSAAARYKTQRLMPCPAPTPSQ